MMILADLTTDQLIALWGVIVVALGIIVGAFVHIFLHYIQKKKTRAEEAEVRSEHEQATWELLSELRSRAINFAMKILVWGPSKNETPEYKARCSLRDKLNERGHCVYFSEDLCASPEALDDPLHDEYLQAVSADAIVMIYKTRGTQTELDKILVQPLIASKAYVLVEEDVLTNVSASLSSGNWEKMARCAKVFKYKGRETIFDKIDEVCNVINKRRIECYIKSLFKEGHPNE